ncbi:PREDICTED: innexin inx2-like, partial [Rhagoletis zephyria]|uniref:innexin inx2-like n=1 Tax=Rhagoletis zephyria TaxID=28612 RepID=UPI00081199AC
MSLAKLVPVSRLKYLTKIRDITIDDFTFRLHYRFTFSFLLIGSILLTGEQFFGKPIQCIPGKDVPKPVIESFCWIEGTFTLPKGLMKIIGFEIAAPGIEQYKEFVEEAKMEKDEVISHSYYQWVGMVLFLQALCFYVPHMLWKLWEKGRVQGIINDLNKIILKAEKKDADQKKLVAYLADNKGKNNAYAFRYFLCELLNLLNIILQMVFVNAFLGGEFASYGMDVWKFLDKDPAVRVDPMSKVFPKMTKCTFRKFGPSGDVQKYDHLCMLPLNILNEKLFIVFWFWFYVVLFFSFASVLYRVMVIGWPGSREFLLARMHNLADPEK